MNEKLLNEIARAEQDAITLSYPRWSFQQSRAKLPNSHELWQQERDKVLQRQQYDNALARDRHRAALEAEKAVKQAENRAQIDAELEPQKQILKREWLANNPTQTENDFEKKAWIHLRQNIIEKRESDAINSEIQRQAASGRYSL